MNSHLDRTTRTLAWTGLVIAVGLVLVAAFPWGDLRDHSHRTKIGWIPFVSPPVRLRDMVLNTLLCAPLGGLAGLLFRRPVFAAFALSLTVSVVAEWTQVYSHSRFPSATDVVCNVAGAVAAALAIRRMRRSNVDHSSAW